MLSRIVLSVIFLFWKFHCIQSQVAFFFFLKVSLCSDDVSSVGFLQRNRRTVTFFPILKGLFTLV